MLTGLACSWLAWWYRHFRVRLILDWLTGKIVYRVYLEPAVKYSLCMQNKGSVASDFTADNKLRWYLLEIKHYFFLTEPYCLLFLRLAGTQFLIIPFFTHAYQRSSALSQILPNTLLESRIRTISSLIVSLTRLQIGFLKVKNMEKA